MNFKLKRLQDFLNSMTVDPPGASAITEDFKSVISTVEQVIEYRNKCAEYEEATCEGLFAAGLKMGATSTAMKLTEILLPIEGPHVTMDEAAVAEMESASQTRGQKKE